ncbi:MAG: hypothetical protein ACRDNB_00030 [Gaiellaceae bacterium]
MRVTDPSGVEWDVSRQWLHVPRRRAGRPRVEDALDAVRFFDGDVDAAGIVLSLALVAILILLFVFGLPLLVLLASFLVAVGGLVVRILFGRPWLVRARSSVGELEWRVRGALGSRRAIHEAAAALARGDRSVTPQGAERVLPESPLRQFR